MNLIITAATGYQAKQLFPLLDSIQKYCGNIKVVVVTYKKDAKTRSILKERYSFVELIDFPLKNKFLVKLFRVTNNQLEAKGYLSKNQALRSLRHNFLHIALKRYFIALDIVRSNKNSIENVLLTDSRDVLLQSDPFELTQDEVVSGLESERMTIEKCTTNSNWIKKIYGEEGLNQVRNRRIICSGVSLGSADKIEKYLIQMCTEMEANLPRIASSDSIDQGIHNYLASTGKITINPVENRSGFIATLGYEDPAVFDKDEKTGLIRVYDKFPAIVHQYDRHPILALNSTH